VPLSPDGQVLLALRRPWPKAGGASVLCLQPVAFLRRLAALVPPPFAHLVRHYGLFAPNARARDLLPAAPVSQTGIRIETELRADRAASSPQPRPQAPLPPPSPPPALAGPPLRPAEPGSATPPSRTRVLPWAELLRRVFAIDVLVCPKCLGPMTVVAFLTDPKVVGKILAHLGLPASPPRLSPARLLAQVELFDEWQGDHPSPALPRTRGRAPPRPSAPSTRDAADDTFDDTFDWGA